MQIVNSHCHVCRRRISSQLEGAYCPNCSIVFHRECVSKAGVCPECREDFDAAALTQRSDEEARTITLINQGRYLTLLCSTVLVGQHLLGVFLRLLSWMLVQGHDFPMVELALLPITLFIAVALYLGVGFFRIYINVSLAISIVALIVLAAYGVTHAYPAFTLGFIAFQVLVDTVIFGLLTLSRSVSWYFSCWSR